MKVIGLTGNIATGKSTVLEMLGQLGAAVLDADRVVHRLLRRATPTGEQVVAAFGPAILDEAGEIDRRRLGRIVFADPGQLARLEQILYQDVRQEILGWLEQARARAEQDPRAPRVAVVDAVKLLEGGLGPLCDQIWVVTASPDVQRERLVKNRRLTAEEAEGRLRSQPDPASRLRAADVIIDNSGGVDETRRQVERAWAQLDEGEKGKKGKREKGRGRKGES